MQSCITYTCSAECHLGGRRRFSQRSNSGNATNGPIRSHFESPMGKRERGAGIPQPCWATIDSVPVQF
eukprot:578120-Pyramimonas_sp.AAC.1